MKIALKIIFFALAYLITANIFAHSGKPKHHVIIDTDGAIDDMRAISMLLAGNDIRVLAITCSQGSLMPAEVCSKVNALLAAFHHQGIQVGIGENTNFELPFWEPFARNIFWAQQEIANPENIQNSTEIITQIVENYPYKITLIALGSLKTYADFIEKKPEYAEKIERIVWYNNSNVAEGFNFKASPESYQYITQSNVSLEIVSNNSTDLFIDEGYFAEIQNINSIYARQIVEAHKQKAISDKIRDKHLFLWDDLIPLYITVPIIFDIETINNQPIITLNKAIEKNLIYETIAQLLNSATTTNNRVFSAFPVDTTLYLPDYKGIVNNTIKKYGLIEWKAICMTNEIHGHTGIYSIIGAKMGVRAMEYFNVGVNNLEVLSFAGNFPPLSCFNDGIQISTGATIGQGLITISDSISNIPTAEFNFYNRKIKISVKPEIAKKMQEEIKFGVETYGLLTDKYWQYIENLAIKYWKDFDRNEIFDYK